MKSEVNPNSGAPKIPEHFSSKELVQVVLVVLFAFMLRVYHLNFQSLWLDELYTMCIANPANSLQEILNGLKTDFHPPLHYFIAHYYFKVVGYSDFSGRLLSAFIGTAGVGAIYFLGREMKDHRLGIMMALVTSVNFFHIFHSQEVRMYILLFFFAIVSMFFCLRAIRRNTGKEYLKFSVATVLLLYTHYFGMFVFAGEIFWMLLMSVIFKSADLKKVLISSLSIIALFLPWIPYILTASHRSHWMPTPAPLYFFNYLYDYTGRDPVVASLFLLGLFLFLRRIVQLYRHHEQEKLAGYLLLFCLLFFVYLPPYVVSQFKPIVQLRCTIDGLPFLIAAIILGLDSLNQRIVALLFTVMIICSLYNLFYIRSYYTTTTKEDFRTLATVVDHLQSQEPVLSQYAMQFNYYLHQMHSEKQVINPEDSTSASLLKSAQVFYILNVHQKEILPISPGTPPAPILNPNDFEIDTIYVSALNRRENILKYERR